MSWFNKIASVIATPNQEEKPMCITDCEIKTRQELAAKALAEAQAKLRLLKEEDQKDAQSVKNFSLAIKVQKAKSATFLSFHLDGKDYEFAADWTESIAVTEQGQGPTLSYNYSSYSSAYTPVVIPVSLGTILIKYLSGVTIPISVSRHRLTPSYLALVKAWKENR